MPEDEEDLGLLPEELDDGEGEDERDGIRRRSRPPQTESQGTSQYGPRFDAATVPDHGAVRGAHSWRPQGPSNAGGRVRALVADPGNPLQLFAGAASGGVFRTRDGGESWQPLFHAEASLSIGCLALAVRADGTRTLWIGTGEKDRVFGAGVWKVEIDAAGTTAPPAVVADIATLGALAPTADEPFAFEACAVAPDEPEHVWFVGPRGVFRLRGGAWSRWEIGLPYMDVKFVGGDATTRARYLVLAKTNNERGDLIRIADPYAGPAAADFTINANISQPLVASPGRVITNTCIAVAPSTGAGVPDRIWVACVQKDEKLAALRRSDAAPADAWNTRGWTTQTVPGSADESAGTYNLLLEVSPHDRDHVVFGMVNLFVTGNGGTTWVKAMDLARFDTGDPSHHADQHCAVFVRPPAPRPTQLWIGNDGGIAVSERFVVPPGSTPPSRPEGFRWRRRNHGLVIGQAYDVTQSPLLPDLHGAAYQDVGAWFSGGTTTWRYVGGGDGLSICFDPRDPYHMMPTWQGQDDKPNGAEDALFGGHWGTRIKTWRDPAEIPPPAVSPPAVRLQRPLFQGLVPLRERSLGILAGDRASFEGSELHPLTPSQQVHVRQRRIYHSTDGDRWNVARVGNRVELLLYVRHRSPTGASARIGGGLIRITGGAFHKLGLLPGPRSALRHLAGGDGLGDDVTHQVHLVGLVGPDFGVADADTLGIEVELFDGRRAVPGVAAPPANQRNRFTHSDTVTFTAADNTFLKVIDTIDTTLQAIAATLRTAIGNAASELTFELRCVPAFAASPNALEIVTRAVGAGVTLTIGGTAAAKLRVPAGDYKGAAGRPAVVTVHCPRWENLDPGAALPADPVAGETLTARIAPAATRTYAFASFAAPATDAERRANNELALVAPALASGLAGAFAPVADVLVRPSAEKSWIRLRSSGTPMKSFSLPMVATSTARAGLTAGATVAAGSVFVVDLIPTKWARYDLAPTGATTSSHLQVNVTGGPAIPAIEFRAVDFRNALTDITVEEAARVLDAALSAHDISVHVEREPNGYYEIGSPTEVAYLPTDPDVIWAGAADGTVYRTRPAVVGAALDWEQVPAMDPALGWPHRIEAIAPVSRTRAFIGMDSNMFSNLWEVDGATWTDRGATLTRALASASYNRGDLGARVYALAIDPATTADPLTLFAATDVGVFRSTNSGVDWTLFNHGLPHCFALDLAIDANTRVLRAAMWGRGIWQRQLGAGTVRDTLLHLRANPRDAGKRPAPHGPDVFARSPQQVTAVRSPDIKVVSIAPAPLGADIDGTEMDEQLEHEAPFAGMVSRVLVQPHNGGAFAVDDVRVIAMWCDATGTLPVIPAAFWTDVATNAVTASATWGDWKRLGDVNLGTLVPGASKVARIDKTWTAGELDGVAQIAIAAFTTTGQTAPAAADTGVADLAVDDGGFALRLSRVARGAGLERIFLSSSKPRFRAFDVALGVATRSNLQFAALTGALPSTYVRSKPVAAGFNLATDRRINIDLDEDAPAGVRRRRISLRFEDAEFANQGAVTAPELRAFLARELAKENLLVEIAAGRIALAIRRSPADRGARASMTAWGMAEIVVVPTATATTDALFAPLIRFELGAASDTADRRYVVRVWNDGDLRAENAEVRLFAIDPLAATPATTAIGGALAVAHVDPGGSALVSVVGRIPAVTGASVLLVATVTHPDDPAPALPATWDAFHTLVGRSDNVAVRTVKKE